MMYLFKGCNHNPVNILREVNCTAMCQGELYYYTHTHTHARRVTSGHIVTITIVSPLHKHMSLTRYRQSSGTSHLKSGFLKCIYTKDPFHNSLKISQ